MTKIIPNPPKIETDFTDAQLTGQGGWTLLSRAARRLDLPRRLSAAVGLKRRRRGASDAEMLWSLIASLATGNGALSDVEALRADAVGCRLLRLAQAPSSRRLGEYLCRFGSAEVAALQGVPGRDASFVGGGGCARGGTSGLCAGVCRRQRDRGGRRLVRGRGQGLRRDAAILAARRVPWAVVGQRATASGRCGRDPGLTGAVGGRHGAAAGRFRACLGARGYPGARLPRRQRQVDPRPRIATPA